MRTRAWLGRGAAIVAAFLVVSLLVLPAESAAPTRNNGYWVAGANAQVFAFGDGQLFGQRERRPIRGQIEDMAAHPSGLGYWLLGRDGGVYPYGEARDLGQGTFREQNAAAIASTPSGEGYWLASQQGEVRAFGDATSFGSIDPRQLGRRIVDMAATPTGGGYLLVDAAGQVYPFGDARSFGGVTRSGGGTVSDVVAIGTTPSADGYWLATASGDVYAFGAAGAFGSLALGGRARLANEGTSRAGRKIVDLTPTYRGLGFWLVDRDGLVFAFGDAVHYGQLAPRDLRSGLVTAIVSTPFVNRDPVATGDEASLDEDTTVDVDVLANDTDEDGDPLTADVLTQPAHGTATRNPDGTLRYAPASDYNGPDSFAYRVSDGFGGSADGTVTLTVRPVNDPPVAADDVYTTDEDVPLAVGAPGVLWNDTDVDGDALGAFVVTPPLHGTLALDASGGFTYTPAPNYYGPDGFGYVVSDGQGGIAAANVSLTVVSVPDPPVAGEDGFTTDEDTPLAVTPPGVLANDSDADGNALTTVLAVGPARGTLTLAADGGFTYTPDANYNGTDVFTYRAFDGALSSEITTVRLTVRPVNDAPVAVPDEYAVDEDTPLAIAPPGPLGNDSDVDGDALTLVLSEVPAHGTLATLPGGGFMYVPDANFFGADGFRYFARDAGGLSSSIVVVRIAVGPVNDAPTAMSDVFGAREDQTLVVDAPGVLGNDADVDSTGLAAAVATAPQRGTLTLAVDGSFTYTPDAGYSGPDGFTYRASDGALDSGDTSVDLFVAPVNDPPVAANDSYTLDEDATLIVTAPGVMVNDSDPDGDELTVRVLAAPDNGDLRLAPDGSFEYAPRPNFNGSDAFTYELSDGAERATATATLTVTAVADAPTAADDAYSVVAGTTLTIGAPGVLANDFAEGGALTAVLVTGVSSGSLTLNGDGSFTYTTTLTSAGGDSFTYKVASGGVDSAPATVTISVSAAGGGSGGGGSGTFGGFGTGTLTVWDFDELNLHIGGTTLTTKLGRVVSKYGSAWYIPNRGVRGHDSFTAGGRRFEIDVISDVWGD